MGESCRITEDSSMPGIVRANKYEAQSILLHRIYYCFLLKKSNIVFAIRRKSDAFYGGRHHAALSIVDICCSIANMIYFLNALNYSTL